MFVNKIGYNQKHDLDFQINRPLGSGDYLLLLIKSKGSFHVGEDNLVAMPGSMILYRKGSPQLYAAYGEEYVNDWIHFDFEENEEELLNELGIPCDTLIELGDVRGMSMLLKNICYEFYSSNRFRNESIESYMKLIFFKLSEKMNYDNKEISSDYHEKMSLIRSQIYSSPQISWNIEGMAKQLQISRSHLEHTYKTIFGLSPMQEVIESRISYGKYLLTSTSMPITQIADYCGYHSDIHFMRQFRQKTGMTPSEFRKMEQASIG